MQNTAMSAAESRALEIDGPQPVWRTLNEARERAFTGEIVFDVEPEVYAYLDNGVVYYAERAGDASLGQRLLEVGVVDDAQLERGTVRVGGVEHLGRLFDRDASVDRDAVLVLTELLTQELITDLANREIASVRVCAYRHHPSGVHRWFVDPAEAVGSVDAGELAAQLGHTGRLSAIPAASDEAPDNELRIEWDEPLGVFEESSTSVFADLDAGRFEPVVDVELAKAVDLAPQAGDDEAAAADVGAPDGESVGAVDQMDVEFADVEFLPEAEDADDEEASEAIDTERDGVGTEAVLDARDAEDVDTHAESVAGEAIPGHDEFQVVWPDGSATAVSEAAVEAEQARTPERPATVHEDDGGFRFEMPPLTFRADESADDVPDDVAAAVRRALAAIETATDQSVSVAPMEDPIAVDPGGPGSHDDQDSHEVDAGVAPAIEWDSSDDSWSEQPAALSSTQEPLAPPPSAPLSGFAPPTPDMSVEAIYRRAGAALPSSTVESSPAGVTSVVFVDEEDDGPGDGERTSALKRLIGSLRRKER